MVLKALALNCSLKAKDGESSSTDAMIAVLQRAFAADGVELTGMVRVAALDIRLGQISSVAKRVLERMDAFLGETDDGGRMPSYGKVAVAAIVGNEDGAHCSIAQWFQVLNDVGWTIPAIAACYWVVEAMASTDFKDLEEVPEKVEKTAKMVAGNAAHLAGLLQSAPYPG
ncbi:MULTISPECIES: NADPH-dependent oxidoreductase [Sphingobium]|uniref:NADPH-dependent oxidoreductase n=1 Tax=Sphingobium TaxID=165695 RepID=UPI00159CC0EA|nr:NADPH-dependent oxidoreductase [Sphingobium sp. 15-1]